MALAYSPSIVTEDLAFYYDMYNTRKSWKGRPVTNQFAIPTPDSNLNVSFQVNGTGTFKRVLDGRYGNYDIQPGDIVYRYDLGGTGCHYHGNDVTITSGQTATWSFDYYVDPSVTGYPSTNYLANFEGVIGGSSGDPTPSVIGVWKRITFTGTAGSTGVCRMLIYPGACGDRLATGGFVLFKNPQVEFDAPGNNPTPFVAGTRSSTQAVFDLTNNNTITASSLTYASDGTFSFNGSSNLLIAPENSIMNTNTPTVEVWVKTSALSQYGFWFEKGQVNTSYSLFQEGGNIVWRTVNSGSSPYDNLLATTASYLSTSAWAHVVATYTSGDKRLYINGIQVANNTASGTIAINANGCSIGAYGGFNGARGYYYNGSIGNVKVYNRALSASEVLQNFNALRGRYGV